MLAIFLYMYFPDRGVYTPYSPCMSTPLLVSIRSDLDSTIASSPRIMTTRLELDIDILDVQSLVMFPWDPPSSK